MIDNPRPDSGHIVTSNDILLHDAETALMYEELRAAIDDGHESMTHADALAEIAAIRAENAELRTGYAAARLEIQSLQARIKTMAEEHADELMVAHLDGRMCAAQHAGAQEPGAADLPEARLFTKKPVTIAAIQWTGHNLREVITFTDGPPDTRTTHAGMAWETYTDLVARDGLKIYTLEGEMLASPGDWIIRGVKGELYPCKPDIFEATYSPAALVEAQQPAAHVQNPAEIEHVAGDVSKNGAELNMSAQQPAPATQQMQGEPVAHLWQHCETGRTRIVMPDMIVDADASWQVVGPLYLGAAPPTAQAEGWRPISTAPKDGALIVLGARNGVWLGKYLPVYQSGYRPENPWSSMLLNHDHMAERYTRPTHWMPLPPPSHISRGGGAWVSAAIRTTAPAAGTSRTQTAGIATCSGLNPQKCAHSTPHRFTRCRHCACSLAAACLKT